MVFNSDIECFNHCWFGGDKSNSLVEIYKYIYKDVTNEITVGLEWRVLGRVNCFDGGWVIFIIFTILHQRQSTLAKLKYCVSTGSEADRPTAHLKWTLV